jgi:hypothetical protein
VRRPRVLYLVGEAPFSSRPDYDVVIAQDLYLPPFEVDAFLPAASFAEAAGTITNLEGRVQEIAAVEDVPPGGAHGFPRPDWKIFSDLAARLGRPDLEYADAAAVRAAIRGEVKGFPPEQDRSPRRLRTDGPDRPRAGDAATAAHARATAPSIAGRGRFVLVPEPAGFRHRGIDLSDVVEGLAELRLESGLRLNPDDLARLGVEPGGTVTLSMESTEGGRTARLFEARPDPGCPRGAAYVSQTSQDPALSHPMRVRISAGDRSQAKARSHEAGSAAWSP